LKFVDDDITMADVGMQADRVHAVVSQVRAQMLAPEVRKQAPAFNAGQIQTLAGLDKAKYDYWIKQGELPMGKLSPSGAKREFTLAEARQWVRAARGDELRPEGAAAATIAIGNFKGGVTKTTTALTLAQGLSLRGHRVLVIDCDPQGSLTTLFGILPDTEVHEADTILPLLSGSEASIRPSIRQTYWDGIDLVAAAPVLFAAEFALASRQAESADFEVWRVLDEGLQDVRGEYDVIVIDTPPSLGYVTINALMAANGIVMPLPPNALDFASSAQFWRMFKDVTDQMVSQRGAEKTFSFISVLPTKVQSTDQSATGVLKWMSAAYAERLLPVEVPTTVAASAASAAFGTVFDASAGDPRTVKRATAAYERVTEMIEDEMQKYWRKQAAREARHD
jgi:ATPases involved in chromosome partitioning